MADEQDTPEVQAPVPYIRLIDVVSITKTADTSLAVVVKFSIAGEDVQGPFGLRDEDAGELATQIRQWMLDHKGEYTIEPYVAPPPAPYQIAKTTPWLRMTDDEAATMDAVMSETSARVKQIYMAASYLYSADPLWQTLSQILTDAFGADRAGQLLAPET